MQMLKLTDGIDQSISKRAICKNGQKLDPTNGFSLSRFNLPQTILKNLKTRHSGGDGGVLFRDILDTLSHVQKCSDCSCGC